MSDALPDGHEATKPLGRAASVWHSIGAFVFFAPAGVGVVLLILTLLSSVGLVPPRTVDFDFAVKLVVGLLLFYGPVWKFFDIRSPRPVVAAAFFGAAFAMVMWWLMYGN